MQPWLPFRPAEGGVVSRVVSRSLSAVFALSLASACKPTPAGPAPDGADGSGPTPATDDASATDGASADRPPEADSLPAAEDVLAAAVAAIGGKDKVAAVTSFYSEATMTIEAQKLSAEIRTWWKNGDFYIENDMAGVGLTQLWKRGDEIWSSDPISGKRKLAGAELAQTAWAGSLSIAADHAKFFTEAKTTGRRTVGEAELVDVVLTDATGNVLTLSFDTSTKLLAEQRFTQATPMGDVPVHIVMDDYRPVAGLMTSHRTVTRMSVVEAVQTLDKFEVGVAIDDAKLTPR